MKRNHLFKIIFRILFFSLLLYGLTSQNSSILASNRSQAISIPTNSRSDVSKYQNISYFTQINETKDNKDILDFTSFDSHNLISQIYDDGTNNIFSMNYWDDHTNEDSNNDGIADTPYLLDGDANNQDAQPRTRPLDYSPFNIMVFVFNILTILLIISVPFFFLLALFLSRRRLTTYSHEKT